MANLILSWLETVLYPIVIVGYLPMMAVAIFTQEEQWNPNVKFLIFCAFLTGLMFEKFDIGWLVILTFICEIVCIIVSVIDRNHRR